MRDTPSASGCAKLLAPDASAVKYGFTDRSSTSPKPPSSSAPAPVAALPAGHSTSARTNGGCPGEPPSTLRSAAATQMA